MAMFRTHLTVSCLLGAAYGGVAAYGGTAGWFFGETFDWGVIFLGAALTAVGGVLPATALGFGPITSWGTSGSGPGQFGEAADVAVGPDFDVYVADRFNENAIQRFSPLGVFRRAFRGPESFGLEVAGDTV